MLALRDLPGSQQAGGSGAPAGAGPWDTPLHSPQALLAHAWQVGQGLLQRGMYVLDVSESVMRCQSTTYIVCMSYAGFGLPMLTQAYAMLMDRWKQDCIAVCGQDASL